MKPAGYMFTMVAGQMIGTAKAAYARAKTAAASDRAISSPDPIIAVVFSAVALEAFINEMIEQADIDRAWAPLAASVRAFGAMGKQIEEQRGQIELKVLAAFWTLGRANLDKGKSPYQDFALLVQLRNALLHRRSMMPMKVAADGTFYADPGKLITALPKSVLSEEIESAEGSVAADFTLRISTPAMARWSCNAASGMVNAILDLVPDDGRAPGTFKHMVETAYRPAFSLVK